MVNDPSKIKKKSSPSGCSLGCEFVYLLPWYSRKCKEYLKILDEMFGSPNFSQQVHVTKRLGKQYRNNLD